MPPFLPTISLAMRIGVLLHENEPPLDGTALFVRMFVEQWRSMGIDVQVLHGIKRRAAVDVLFPQVNLTVTPWVYRGFIEAHANVINRDLYDISKRRVSARLVDPGRWPEGPVIVKSNLNYGGLPEERLTGEKLIEALRPLFERGHRKKRLHYRIFDHAREVPPKVWSNSALVVERFLPEREGELYFVRTWTFFGSRGVLTRGGSRHPIVKSAETVVREVLAAPPRELVEFRARWKMDYGKIDYVVHEGVPIVLDVNRTPSAGRNPRLEALALDLSGAIDELFPAPRWNVAGARSERARVSPRGA